MGDRREKDTRSAESNLSLKEARELIDKEVISSIQRQLGILRKVDPVAVVNALIFARVSNQLSRFTHQWIKVSQRTKNQDYGTLPAELRVALEMMPTSGSQAEVFDGALQALRPWVESVGCDFQLTLPPDFLDLFGNAQERQRWERLREEQSLNPDWNATSYTYERTVW